MLAVLAVGFILWLIPSPESVDPRGWHLLAIFAATIVALVVRPLPPSAASLLAIAVCVLTGTLSMGQALSGFGRSVVWLVVAAFFIASGFNRTGLGRRLAYLLVAALGRKSLGLAYSLIATDLILAPGIPSNTARTGGVVYPILQSVGHAFGSRAEEGTSRRLSAFLTVCVYQGTVVTSAMFLTAVAVNPLIAGLAGSIGIELTWSLWAWAAVVPGLVSLGVVPLVVYRLYPPEIRETPRATVLAREELAKMGRMSSAEWAMLTVFVAMLILWSLSGLGVDTTASAIGGVGVLLVLGVITWDDLLRERAAWDTMVWFATILMMAGFLTEMGLVVWFSSAVAGTLSGVSWAPTLLGVALLYFYTHYFFAGNSSHAGAMYLPFLGIALASGAPAMAAALLLGYFSSLFAGLTHYGTAPGPILFGAHHVPLPTWWRLGAVISVVNIVIWLGVGGFWWKAIGIW